jgi:lipopolysaccharide/colanic/teichoic acid biosynthesis glycosyltransferase
VDRQGVSDRGAERPSTEKRAAERTRRRHRVHLQREVTRVATLLLLDASVFLGTRRLLRSARDWNVFGDAVAEPVRTLVPFQSIPGNELGVALIGCLALAGAYRRGDAWRDAARILLGTALGTLLAFYAVAWIDPPLAVVGRGVLAWVVLGTLFVAARSALWRVVRWSGVGDVHRVLWVQGTPHAVSLGTKAGELARGALGGRYEIVDRVPADRVLSDGLAISEAVDADTVLVDGQLPAEAFQRLVDEALAEGLRLLVNPPPDRRRYVEPRPVVVGEAALLEFTAPGLRAGQLILKRSLDLVGSLALLLALFPLLLLLALWVKLDSPGPVLFAQRRMGRDGVPFPMLKFRSMRPDAEAVLEADVELFRRYLENDYKLPEAEDPRITTAGRILRRTSLDELPQLVNVLAGQMSLVGPRPVVPEQAAEAFGSARGLLLSLKPGITGWWAVSGRAEVQYPERAWIEAEYVRDWSIFRDLSILLRTIPAVILRRGAF